MVSSVQFSVFLCLTIGLWMEAQCRTMTRGDVAAASACLACPAGWTEFDGDCYIFHSGPKDWADAEVACVAQGGNLASVDEPEQYDFLKATIKKVTGADTRTWIGGHDSVKEGVWLWTDGTMFVFEHWAPGEPNNAGKKEHCLELNYLGKPNDVMCTDKKPFICKMSL